MEAQIKSLHRHAGEYQHPVNNCFDWILAYARMTTQRILGLIQRFPMFVSVRDKPERLLLLSSFEHKFPGRLVSLYGR